MALKITSATHRGLDGVLISVEVDITRGIPSFSIIVYISKIFKWSCYDNYIKGKSALRL